MSLFIQSLVFDSLNSFSPILSRQTTYLILVTAYQTNAHLEANTVVDLVDPPVARVEAFGDVPLHVLELLSGQCLAHAEIEQDIVVHVSLMLGALMQPGGEQLEEFIVILIFLLELQILKAVTVSEIIHLIGTEETFLLGI